MLEYYAVLYLVIFTWVGWGEGGWLVDLRGSGKSIQRWWFSPSDPFIASLFIFFFLFFFYYCKAEI